jgi:hypothetical protein
MQHSLTYIRAAIGCGNLRTRSHYVKRDGITYVAQSDRALRQLLGNSPDNSPAIRCTIRAGLMRRLDQFHALSRRIAREFNCDPECARAIARRQLRG